MRDLLHDLDQGLRRGGIVTIASHEARRRRAGARGGGAVWALLAALCAVMLVSAPVGAQHTEPVTPPAHGAPATEPAHGEEAAHAPSIMQVNPGLMIWTVVTFVILLTVLRFTAWKPLQASLDARERRIRDAVEGAERARQESEALLEQHRRMLDSAKDEARKIIEEGKADGLRLRHEITAQARTEVDEHKARARRELELATDQAKKELWEHATRLSTELAERIVQRSLGADDHRRLVEGVLEEYRTEAARSAD
jgi:F-type H+-transporting ATPase subunit b